MINAENFMTDSECGYFYVHVPFKIKDQFKKAVEYVGFNFKNKTWSVMNDQYEAVVNFINANAAEYQGVEDRKKNRLKGLVKVEGNTYPIKDIIKNEYKGVYDGNTRAWYVTAENLEIINEKFFKVEEVQQEVQEVAEKTEVQEEVAHNDNNQKEIKVVKTTTKTNYKKPTPNDDDYYINDCGYDRRTCGEEDVDAVVAAWGRRYGTY